MPIEAVVFCSTGLGINLQPVMQLKYEHGSPAIIGVMAQLFS